jgi:hypothetical protein
MSFAARLREFMLPGESVVKFARRIGYPVETVRAWVKDPGGSLPELNTFMALAKKLNASFVWLYDGTGPKFLNKTNQKKGEANVTGSSSQAF